MKTTSLIIVAVFSLMLAGCYTRPTRVVYVYSPPQVSSTIISNAPSFQPPSPVQEVVVVSPGPECIWVQGSWVWGGSCWLWHRGYWGHGREFYHHRR